MTDEEPFIRAIVDSPGDEIPRLVYADWLEERGDPRAAYLQAELEAVRTGNTSRVQDLAVGLDSVWVARVTLPPLGVCCEHAEIQDRGPVISPQDIEQFEQDLGVTLPDDYRAFLLNYNGGHIACGPCETPDGEVIGLDGEHVFYSLKRLSEDDQDNGLEKHDAWRRQYIAENFPDPRVATWLSQFIDVGRSPDWIHGVLVGVTRAVFGQIRHIDYSVDFDPAWLEDISQPEAPSFAKYLSTLPWKAHY